MNTKLDPIDRDILRTLFGLDFGITPSQIAQRIGIHPTTAVKRLNKLIQLKLVVYIQRGNRMYCKLSLGGIRKFKFY